MKIIPLILLIALAASVVIYHENRRCEENRFSNCRVGKEGFERISTGLSYRDVLGLLGEKNMERERRDVFEVCRGADSQFTWGSREYPEGKAEMILVGFKDDRVHCKVFMDARDDVDSAIVDDFIRDGFVQPIALDMEKTVSILGRPDGRDVEDVKNIHIENGVDQMVTLRYAGFSVRYFVPGPGNPSKPFPVYAESNSPEIKLRHSIEIGMNRSAVVQLMGAPANQSSDSLKYIGASDMGAVSFVFSENHLVKVAWYLDGD